MEDKRGGVGGWPAGGNMHAIFETCIKYYRDKLHQREVNE